MTQAQRFPYFPTVTRLSDGAFPPSDKRFSGRVQRSDPPSSTRAFGYLVERIVLGNRLIGLYSTEYSLRLVVCAPCFVSSQSYHDTRVSVDDTPVACIATLWLELVSTQTFWTLQRFGVATASAFS